MKAKLLLLVALLAASASASAATLYVDAASAHPAPPYNTWTNAAAVIQDAVDASAAGDEVVVTNGVYATGGRAVYGILPNRVAVTKPVMVRSVNGPESTTIQGYQVLGRTNGNGAIRCIYLTNGAVLSGFTLTKGATRTGGYWQEDGGGGVWGESPNSLVTNCTIIGNAAHSGGGASRAALRNCALMDNRADSEGGGCYQGIMNNCTLQGNWSVAIGGGASEATLNSCLLAHNSAVQVGGATVNCTLNSCSLTNNWAGDGGGGAWMCTLNECALVDNVTVSSGGGAGYSTLNHCTLTGNVAADGGATYDGTLNNCLLANNSADYWAGGACRGTLNDCMLTNNWAIYGGGAGEATLNFCTVAGNWADEGGGAEAAYLNNCMVFSNTAGLDGGGVAGCMVSDSTLVGNRAQTGGGAASSTLNNCTIVGNSTLSGGGVAIGCALANSIVYYNWSDPEAPGSTDSSFDHCCLPEDPGGTGNITNEPAFVDLAGGDLRLQASSPCINAGNNDAVASSRDLDGSERIVGGSVDMGAYEWSAGTTHYVSLDSANPLPPYRSWRTAATNIQDAVDASGPGDEIIVTNGIYATGGRLVGEQTNRVVVDKALTLRSVNGPEVTVIAGYKVPGDDHGFGDAAIRCVYLTNGAVLSGFTLTNGATAPGGDGGGLRGPSTNAVAVNCIFRNNSAYSLGGGACFATLNNCTLTSNEAPNSYGGGAAFCVLNNCTLAGNTAYYGGGAHGCLANNSIVFHNTTEIAPGIAGNYNDSTFHHGCTSPLPLAGVGNITNEPVFVDWAGGDLHLQSNSPCINAGDNASVTGSTDLDGNERVIGGTVDMGAYEWVDVPTHYVSASSSNPVPPYRSWSTAATNIQDAVDAAAAGDEIVVTNGVYAQGGRPANGFSLPNRVAVENPLTLRSVNGPGMTIIQGCQNPAIAGVEGPVRCVYLADGTKLSGFTLTNGATFPYDDRPFRSPSSDVIQVPTKSVAPSFTWDSREASGGGVWCESTNALITNCIVTGNAATYGGGAYAGTLDGCILTANFKVNSRSGFTGGGGASSSILNNCTLQGNSGDFWFGGGADFCTLNNCTLTGNSSSWHGGGASRSILNNCRLSGNLAAGDGGGAALSVLNNCILMGNRVTGGALGGGAHGSTLNNCTLTGNSAGYGGDAASGGASYCTLNNCILYYNGSNSLALNHSDCSFNHCCTFPMPENGVGNFTNKPAFLDWAGGDFRLQTNSPCINAGDNSCANSNVDLAGNPRIVGGTVDIGAYEFQSPTSIISYAWLQQFGLPTDGSADFADSDGDRLNTWQEWRCGTDPTNTLSVLRLLPPALAGADVTLSWPSGTGRSYVLECSTNLGAAPSFFPLATNLPGQPGTTSFTHTNGAGLGRCLYRVAVP